MSKKPSILLASGFVFVLAMILWGVPAGAAPNYCSGECTCNSSCSQVCQEIDGISTCGSWGVCRTSPHCVTCFDDSDENDSLVGMVGNDGIVNFAADDVLWDGSGNEEVDHGSGSEPSEDQGDRNDMSERPTLSE